MTASGEPGPIRTRFTDRASGNLSHGVPDDPAALAARRRRLAAELGAPGTDFVWMDQVHGTTVATVRASGIRPATDVLVTDRPELVLAVLVADCVPVLAADPVAGVVGAAHAGRRGAAAGVLPALLDAMSGLGARPARIEVQLGPAICGRCYEVPEPMRAEVDAALPGSASTTTAGTPGLDLRAGLAAQALALGVVAVTVSPRCTFEDRNLFSHRRDAPTGRQAGLIWSANPGVSHPQSPESGRYREV